MNKKIKRAHDYLKKKYKDDIVLNFGTGEEIERTETGIIGLDYITGGGLPKGSATEFWGKEQTGKTTFSYKTIANYQRQGKSCVYVDAENNYDKKWAKTCGIDVDNLLRIKAGTLEKMGDVLVDLTLQNIDLIVVDSIIALIPEQELERDLDEPQRSSQARVISPMTRKLNEALMDKEITTTYLFVNQIRENLGRYGSPYKTAGGRALLHFYRIRIEFKVTGFIEVGKKEDKERIGQEIRILANKNQTSPPYRKSTVDFYYEDGAVDNIRTLVYACVKYGVVELKGSFYSYKKTKKQGIEKFMKYVKDKGLYEELKNKLWKQLRFGEEDG